MNDLGKLPPQARDFEQVVLGAILTEEKAIYQVIEILTVDSFYVDAHQKIYQAIMDLHNEGRGIDILTVTEHLKQRGQLDAAGGSFAITTLTSTVGSSAHIRQHALVIYEKYLQRKLISSASEILKLAYEDETDVFDLLGRSQNMMDEINNSISNSEPFSEAVSDTIIELTANDADAPKSALITYIEKFDKHTGGLHPGDLVIVAGRPGMGKSSVMCDWAYYQAKNNVPIGIFTLEMSKRQLIHRFLSIETSIPYQKMRTGGLSGYEKTILGKIHDKVASMPMLIHDEGGIGIGKIMSIAKMWKHKFDIKAIYVDYLQLATAGDLGKKFGSREQEVSTISGKLKILAKNLGIPVIALSQLSRAVESREGKKPMLSDLRESGAIEQDADMIIFPFRPAVYEMNDSDGQPFSQVYMDMIIAKFRAGQPTDLNINFEMPYSRFIREAITQTETPF